MDMSMLSQLMGSDMANIEKLMQGMIDSHRARLKRLSASHPQLPDLLHGLAGALAARSHCRSSPADLEEAIKILRKLSLTTPLRHPSRPSFLFDLGDLLIGRFEQDNNGRFSDLEESIALHRDVLKLRPPPHSDRPPSLLRLAMALISYVRVKGAPPDLKECIDVCREALDLHPSSHPSYCSLLSNLATTLYTRFEKEEAFKDLEESIMLYRRLLNMKVTGPHPDRSASLYNLANALSSRFDKKGNSNDLEESIALYRKALAMQPSLHADRWKSLTGLGATLITRCSHNRDLRDFDDAIAMLREVLDLQSRAHPDRCHSLLELARALSARFERTGDLQDLEDCITLSREALELRQLSHSDRSSALQNLGTCLHTRFEQKSDFQDLEECILLLREALTIQRTHHINYSASLTNLACALCTRFEQRGNAQDAEDSISFHREALDAIPVSDPFYATAISNLARATSARFEHRGTLEDLEGSIALYRSILESQPASHVYRGVFLNNLAKALSARFQRNGIFDDNEESILLHREALSLRPESHPDRYVTLVNLAGTLVARGSPPDLEESIMLYKEALSALPSNHSDYLWSLRELAAALARRYRAKASAADLDDSISLYERVVSLEPPSHPTHVASLTYLGQVKFQRFKYSRSNQDLEGAFNYFETASKHEAGLILLRFEASRNWADCAQKYCPDLALNAYSYAITLLPLLASLDLTLQQRQDVLQHSEKLAGSAAKCAINARQYIDAVLFLSTGRSVFWSQALQLRTSAEELAASHPTIAGEFVAVSRQLEQASYSGHLDYPILNSPSRERVHASTKTSPFTLADKRSRIIEEIRRIPGFDRFLLPPSFLSLQSAADRGPVVLLNASELGCGALILRANGLVDHVPLLLLNTRWLGVLQALFGILLEVDSETRTTTMSQDRIRTLCDFSQSEVSETEWESVRLLGRDMNRIIDSPDSNQSDFRVGLESLWVTIVQPVLESLELKKTDAPTRVWWCPTGPFTSLPIHAAGIYTEDNEPVNCLFQYAVSSYCTSPLDLLHSPPRLNSGFQMTAIIEPDVPGSLPLPATRKELREIEKHVQESLITHTGSKEIPTQIEKLFSDIKQSTFVHFGCHGMQDLTKSFESYLLLSGGKLTMSRIMKECQVPEGALAYLSACETAKGDGTRPDESLNLVATMMFAGFRSVVGTLWSIFDEDAPVVAEVFYSYLFRNGKEAYPDIRDAAYGLHLATKKLRDQGKPFQSWVPYVHYGV